MSSDLVALVVALSFGIAVVVLGVRHDLSETTRNWLPRLEPDPERGPPTLGLYAGEKRRRRPLSRRQRRWMIGAYLLMSLSFAAFAALAAQERLLHAALAIGYALNVVVFWFKRLPSPRDSPVLTTRSE